MKKPLIASAAGALLTLAAPLALAQATGLTVTTGVDYVEGKYGTDTRDNWTWTVPVIVKYETGPVTLKVSVPYVRTHGVNRDVSLVTRNETQSGLGDTVVSGFYNVADERKLGLGVDLGLKAKFVTADKDKDLITTGNEDYSLQADLYKTFNQFTAFGSIGWTSKGDIRFRDPTPTDPNHFSSANPKDPWYASIGGAYKLDPKSDRSHVVL